MNNIPAPLRCALALLAQLVVAMPLAADDGDADPTFADGGQMSFVVAAPADVGNRILAITALADGALSRQGHVVGLIPRFMTEVEWPHPGLATLEIVEDMRERKHRLLTGSDAVVALPGGCGTLEELFEAMTLKRLGIYFNPIVLLNTAGFYDDLQAFLLKTIDERMMNREHAAMWSLVDAPERVLAHIRDTPRWREDAREMASVKPY